MIPAIVLFVLTYVLMLMVVSFIPEKTDVTNGVICCILFVIGLVYNVIRNKTKESWKEPVMAIDFSTIGILVGLLSGATLGGNCTPIGASANITGIGILRKNGYEVKNSDFFKIGIPFTFAAIVPAYIYIWLVYGI